MTILCQNFGVNDITSVVLVGHSASSFYWINSTTVLVLPSLAPVADTGHIVINSTSYGTAVLRDAFTYNPSPVITGVSPSVIRNSGGVAVTVLGANLGYQDVFEVTLCGVYAPQISWLSSTSVRVLSAPAATLTNCTGAVTIASRLWGNASLANAITYLDRMVFCKLSPEVLIFLCRTHYSGG